MGKFKVGQWVRSLVDWGSIEKGKVYQIPYLDDDGEPWFTPDGSGGWTDYLSLDEIEPWTPRVGDRVKMIKEVDGLKANCGATVVHNDGSQHHPILLQFDEKQRCGHTGDGRTKDGYGWWVGANDIEPLPVAAEAKPAVDKRADAGGGFKAGDMIRLVKSGVTGSRTVGNVYEAVERNSASAPTSVNFIDDEGDRTWAPGEYFELHKTLQIEAVNDNAPAAEQPAAKKKFKVGERVLASWGDTSGPGTVIRYHKIHDADEMPHLVKFDSGETFWVYDKDIAELVEQPTAIVALIENGQPKPSHRPHVHASVELAEKEANRLAEKFKGRQFGVYVLSSTSEKAKPAYEHQWQRLAADGQKLAAVRELRVITGMSLKPAKDAVEYFLQAA